MVEYTSHIDKVFSALADPLRRDIFERTSGPALTVNQIALEYDISLAAVSKQLNVLFDAGLISRRKDGRYIYVSSVPDALQEAISYVRQYERLDQAGTVVEGRA